MDGDAFVYVAKDSLAIVGSRPDYVEDARYECLQVPEGLTVTALVAVRADDGTITLQEDPLKVEAKTAQAWTALRTERNARLAASDWTQLQDAHLSAEKKSAWADYRQALRDLPDECTDPTQVDWPLDPTVVVQAPVTGSRLSSLLTHADVEPVVPVVEVTEAEPVQQVTEAEPVQEVAAVEPVVESPVVTEA